MIIRNLLRLGAVGYAVYYASQWGIPGLSQLIPSAQALSSGTAAPVPASSAPATAPVAASSSGAMSGMGSWEYQTIRTNPSDL